MTPPSQWIALAHLLRPQGRRGELLADPLTDLPGLLTPGREVALVATGATSPAPSQPTILIESAWSPTGKNAGRLVLKLSGCDTISQAESLADHDLLLTGADIPALDPDTFFVRDLLGCDLYDGPTLAGVVVDVHFPTSSDGRRLEDAAPLLAIQPTPEPNSDLALEPGSTSQPATNPKPVPETTPEPILVPFIRAWLDSVDIPARRVVMHLPPGLLD